MSPLLQTNKQVFCFAKFKMASAFGPSGPECECPIFCRMYQNLENLRANQKLLWLDIIDALIWVGIIFSGNNWCFKKLQICTKNN